MRSFILLAAIGVVAACLAPAPATAGSPFDFDGTWIGTLHHPDIGTCGSRHPAIPVHTMNIEYGRLRSYSFATSGGSLPMTGGFVASGRFDARGYQPGKGAVTFVGQADDIGLHGRWSAQARPGDSCSGTFFFQRQTSRHGL